MIRCRLQPGPFIRRAGAETNARRTQNAISRDATADAFDDPSRGCAAGNSATTRGHWVAGNDEAGATITKLRLKLSPNFARENVGRYVRITKVHDAHGLESPARL